MKYYPGLLLFILLLAACNMQSQAPIPAEKMQKVLMDLHFAETYSMMVGDTSHKAKNKNYDSLAVYYHDILQHYKISEEELKKSLDYYRDNPEEMDTVYNRMLPELSKLEGISQINRR